MDKSDKAERNQSVIKMALAMSSGTLASRVLGFVRDVVLAALFSRTVTDAFVVAFRLPNMFRRLLGEGSLSVSFIPVYVEFLRSHDQPSGEEKAKALAGGVYAALLIMASTICVLGVVFMEPLVAWLIQGKAFISIPGKLEQTTFLARIMFSYLFLVSNYALAMAILQCFGKFFLPALAPALFNLTFIVFALLPWAPDRVAGEQLAWGVLAGGLLQLSAVAIPLLRQGHWPRPRLRFRSVTGLATVFKNMGPGLLGMGVLQLMGLVNVAYASRLPEGSHSYIYWADRVLELPQSLLAISLGAALLPTLSALWSRGDREKMRHEGQRHMQILLFLAIPCGAGLFALAEPIVEVLFQRGQFGAHDVEVTAQVVRIYSVLLIFSGLHKVTIPSFYAIKNTWLPAMTSAVALSFHVILAYFWVDIYGLQGLVASTTLSGLLNLVLVLTFYQIFIGPLNLTGLLKSAFHCLPAAIVMGWIVTLTYGFLIENIYRSYPFEIVRAGALLVTVALGAGIYFVINALVRHPQMNQVRSLLKKKVS